MFENWGSYVWIDYENSKTFGVHWVLALSWPMWRRRRMCSHLKSKLSPSVCWNQHSTFYWWPFNSSSIKHMKTCRSPLTVLLACQVLVESLLGVHLPLKAVLTTYTQLWSFQSMVETKTKYRPFHMDTSCLVKSMEMVRACNSFVKNYKRFIYLFSYNKFS